MKMMKFDLLEILLQCSSSLKCVLYTCKTKFTEGGFLKKKKKKKKKEKGEMAPKISIKQKTEQTTHLFLIPA